MLIYACIMCVKLSLHSTLMESRVKFPWNNFCSFTAKKLLQLSAQQLKQLETCFKCLKRKRRNSWFLISFISQSYDISWVSRGVCVSSVSTVLVAASLWSDDFPSYSSFSLLWLKSNLINTSPEPTWSRLGSEKVVNKMNMTRNLLILTTEVLVLAQVCELLIYMSSSTMFKSGDDVTNDTVTSL